SRLQGVFVISQMINHESCEWYEWEKNGAALIATASRPWFYLNHDRRCPRSIRTRPAIIPDGPKKNGLTLSSEAVLWLIVAVCTASGVGSAGARTG
ncbi:MAG: hypothetical protein ACKOUR_00355, partial [Planctomycetota bacterium]